MLDAHKQHTRVQLRQLSATHHRPLRLLEYNYIGSPSVAPALPQLRCAPRLLISRPHGFYINYVVHYDYSSPGCIGNTSTLPSAATTRHPVARSNSPTPRVQVPRHITRLVTRLVAPLVVDNSASHRLVVDYFASAARPGASAHRAARHADRRAARCRQLRLAQARRRLLRPRRAFGCLGTSRGSSRGSSRIS
jgi:hypothetical protein